MKDKILLNQNWAFRAEKETAWMPATVPGCNYLDLMANGVIDDPDDSYDGNQQQQQGGVFSTSCTGDCGSAGWEVDDATGGTPKTSVKTIMTT